MKKTIEIDTVRKEIDRVIDDVAKYGDHVVVDQDGKRVAAIVPISVYDNLEREGQEFLERMEQAALRANMSEEEADVLVAEAIAWARSQDPS
jgi:prevent-host-death family protein